MAAKKSVNSLLQTVTENIAFSMRAKGRGKQDSYVHFPGLLGRVRDGNLSTLQAEATGVILDQENRGASGSELRGLLKARFMRVLPGCDEDEMGRFVKCVVPGDL